ncbi:hypothetical protein B566_EDAN002952 [Ephemera danica]|nr:hypothetical protein B566_EDAN002952 [Ephemera danica]
MWGLSRLLPWLLLLPLIFLQGVAEAAPNNRPPRFLIDGQTEIVLRLKEGSETPVGTLIYRLRGFDPDGDPLTFGVRESSGSDVLRIEPANDREAHVYLRKELDRERRDEYALVLTLTDGRLGEGNFITQSLLLLVEDVNDNAPVFRPHPPAVSVREDSPPRALAELEATDLDEGPYGQVVYSLLEQPGDEGMFSVTTSGGRGVVRLLGRLDYETKSLYQLRVLATDRSNNDRINSATAALLIRVEDVEDSPPEFTLVPPLTRVSEDVPVGTSVLSVKAVDGDRGINNRIVYSISRGGDGLFGIDATSGVAQEQSRAVTPGPVVHAEVTVMVMDVNDEAPRFRGDNYVLAVSEGAQTATPLVFLGPALPEVYDHDQGNNGTFELLLQGDGGVFEVTPSRGINEASFLIRVKNPDKLDYERVKTMNFTLVAREIVPKNPRTSSVPVSVYIQDVNDNFPEFTEPVYEVTVPENSRAGTTVAWIQAMDEDSGNFGTQGIRYTIVNKLHLDPVTGVLTVRTDEATFDRELVDRHFLTVEARDDLGRGNRNTVQLTVNVADENDNAPEFVLTQYEARLLENSADFNPPLRVLARDLDLNGTRNSAVWYSLAGGEWQRNFTVDPETGRVRPLAPLDFERVAGSGATGRSVRALSLVLRASDHGEPPLSAEAPLTVYLHDANDHAPMFEKPHYTTSVPEDLPPGSQVIQVKAYDRDGSSPNNMVVYRLAGGHGDKFVMDAETGVISVATGASLDPDRSDPRAELYALRVLALDGGIGSEQRSTEVIVEVAIEDVNNKPPTFLDPGNVVVRENTPVGETVAIVRASDPDAKPVLRYHIDAVASEARGESGTLVNQADYNFTAAFALGPVDGQLRMARLIDREKVDLVRLVLLVEDLAATKGRQTASEKRYFEILSLPDENDNAPVFRQPALRATVAENAPPGTVVTRVLADDADRNRTLRYTLEVPLRRTVRESGEEEALLHLDAESGELRVASRIDREATAWLNLTVRATDNGVPPRHSFAQVFVQVLDENDNNPYFIDDATNITVREDAPIGTEVARIAARDADAGDFGKITYLLDRRSSQGKFEIDADTGALTVAAELNREEQNFFTLVIEAWDNYQFGYAAGESRNVFKQIGVNIVDVNDERPEFEPRGGGCASVTEFHEPGELITVVRAIDRDDPNTPNGRLQFDIEEGNELGLFAISSLDHTSARITAALPLRSLYGNYSLVVRASDLGSPPNSAVEMVRICVTDFNDHPPRFVSPPANLTVVRVPENATVGSIVAEVRAEDEDIGANGAVRYRLKQDSLGHWRSFDIDHVTGVLILKVPLDREKQKMYDIRVEAYDLGIPTPLSSDLELTLYVSNVNDFEPQFVQSEVHLNFTENVLPGMETSILPDTVDRDELDLMDGPPPPVCYFIVGGNSSDLFILDPFSHELSVAAALDRENQAEHELVVRATESCASPPQRIPWPGPRPDGSLLLVRVHVLDQNDNAPRFVKRTFTGGVSTEADFGTQFMQVKAVDIDSPEHANVSYYLSGRVKTALSEGLENIRGAPFLVDRATGAISLNFDPQRGMKGYFDFKVIAKDAEGLQDEARVLAYLLREDQRVRFVLRQHPAEVREKIERFRDVLGSVTGAVINADEFKLHENQDGSVDRTRTDLYLHLVDVSDNSVLDVNDALRRVDRNIEKLDSLFKEFNVLDTQPASAAALLHGVEMEPPLLMLWLAASTALLAALLTITVAVCLSQRARYMRQLKAATAVAFGGTLAPATDPGGGRVPNTNKHSSEGSNPMWMQSYENEWFKDDEEQSTCSPSEPNSDSLDENAVEEPSQPPVTVARPTPPRAPSTKAPAPPPPPLLNNGNFLAGRRFGRVKTALSEGLENIRGAPFLVDRVTGAISLNFDPQRGMKGYFDFKVIAKDAEGLQDEARVLAYLLREDQRVRFVLRQHPAEVREKIERFRDVLGSVTGAVINADEFKLHENQDGSVDRTRTDLYLHLVDVSDNSVLDVNDALRRVDRNIEKLDSLFKEFNVLDTQPASAAALLHGVEMEPPLLMLWLAASTALLAALLTITVAVCLSQRARYMRQLKAATAVAFGGTLAPATDPGGGRVPNTNKHSSEGSNPMWMQSYENEWFKDDEEQSTCSPSEPNSDSLDENAVEEPSQPPVTVARPTPPRAPSTKAPAPPPPPLLNNGNFLAGRRLSNMILEESTTTVAKKEQNDLNRTQTFHQNLYMQLDKLQTSKACNVRLETTEL